jgi:hypothetical protein
MLIVARLAKDLIQSISGKNPSSTPGKIHKTIVQEKTKAICFSPRLHPAPDTPTAD